MLEKKEKSLILKIGKGKRSAHARGQSIPSLFETICKQAPNQIAIRFAGQSMSYKELNEKANQLARHLRSLGVKKQEFVGISLDRSPYLAISLLAVLKLGAAYVPIDPGYPADRREFMLKDTKIRTLITEKAHQRLFGKRDLVCVEEFRKPSSSANLGIKINPNYLAYINYTSGSTGMPKGVEIIHQGILRFAEHGGSLSIHKNDHVLNMSNISFDATAAEVWGTLLNGACLCIFTPKEFSFEKLGQFLSEETITKALFTAKVFNLLIEHHLADLKTLRRIVSVGEAMSASHAKVAFQNLPNCKILNAYGPTENSAETTDYLIRDLKEIEQAVPIGRPIVNTEIYLFDANKQLVPIGVAGELYAGGEGVAKGYLNRPDLTKEKFCKNPFGKGSLYKTGDLAAFLPSEDLLYLGRSDDQIKIRGFRIEPGEIEELLRRHAGVADCAVLAREDTPGELCLVAYIELKKGKKITNKELNDYAASKLPPYMVPSFFIILDKFPMTPNGKVNRKELPSPTQTLEKRELTTPETPTEKILAELWIAILKIPKIDRQDNFFQIGGHSISAAQLTSLVHKTFGISISVSLIFEESTLQNYARRIDQLLSQTNPNAKPPVTTTDLFWIWRNREAVLDPSIIPEKTAVEDTQYTHPKKIFLTGATGFVGAFFLKELIETTQATIYCHVRADSEKEALSRLLDVLKKYLLWKEEYLSRIVAVPGDLEKKHLGIKPLQFESLAEEIDSIFHIGAFVNHALPYQKLKAANVFGTQEALRLACRKRLKPFHFLSTVAILENKGTFFTQEATDIQKVKFLFNGYAQSKWVGEKLIEIARSRGVPANIYRLSRVSGDSRVGSGPTGDFLWRVVQACILLGLAPNIDYREEVTPVDYVCNTIGFIATKKDLINQPYHVSNPHFYPYLEIFKLLQKLGCPLKIVDFDTWRKQLVKEAIQGEDEQLKALVPLFAEVDLSISREFIAFSDEHVAKALKGSGIHCHKVDEQLFKKYIDYYVKTGFLKAWTN